MSGPELPARCEVVLALADPDVPLDRTLERLGAEAGPGEVADAITLVGLSAELLRDERRLLELREALLVWRLVEGTSGEGY